MSERGERKWREKKKRRYHNGNGDKKVIKSDEADGGV